MTTSIRFHDISSAERSGNRREQQGESSIQFEHDASKDSDAETRIILRSGLAKQSQQP